MAHNEHPVKARNEHPYNTNKFTTNKVLLLVLTYVVF